MEDRRKRQIKNMNVKKVLNIAKTVLVWIVLVISVFMMIFTIVSVNTFDKNDRPLFGYKFFIVQTDSMSATHFNAGDVIISKEVDINTLKPDDVITFVSQNSESLGQTITHAIREVTEDADGNTAFVTYGTTTDKNDEALATMIVGQYQTKIPKLGHFFAFLKTTPGYIVCVLVPFVILLLSQGINCIQLFRKYRAEQMEDINAERKKIETEREESRKMMEELMALKAQLASNAAAAAAPAPVEDASVDGDAEAEVTETESVEVAGADQEAVEAEAESASEENAEAVEDAPVAVEAPVEEVSVEEAVEEAPAEETVEAMPAEEATVEAEAATEAPAVEADAEPSEEKPEQA